MSSSSRTDSASNGRSRVQHDRTRSGSLTEKGAAVIRALQRAPEDESPEGTPSGALTPHLEVDTKDPDGYAPEGQAETSPRYPQDSGAMADVSRSGSTVGLSDEQKRIGRLNREGLRRRGEAREVEKLVGKTAAKGGDGAPKKSKKSWEIPRKIFHSSIGFMVLTLYLSYQSLEDVVNGLSIFLAIVITADVIRLNYPPFERFYERVLGFLMREAEKEKVNGVVWYLVGVIWSLHFYPADIACVSVMILSWADTAASVFGRLFGRYTPPLPSPPFATRKSLSGFLAAILAGAACATLFWGTSIAQRGQRFDGLSWNPEYAVFGANAPGWLHSGWSGWSWGFRGHLPTELADKGPGGKITAAWDAASRRAAQLTQGRVGPSHAAAPAMPLPVLALGSGLVAAVAEGLELGGLDDNLSLPILSGFGLWAWLFVWGRAAVAFAAAQSQTVAAS